MFLLKPHQLLLGLEVGGAKVWDMVKKSGCIYVYTHTHTYIYIYPCIYVYVYIHMYMYMYMHVYVCIYIYIQVEYHHIPFLHIHRYTFISLSLSLYIYIYVINKTSYNWGYSAEIDDAHLDPGAFGVLQLQTQLATWALRTSELRMEVWVKYG